MGTLWQDLRYSFRVLLKSRSFTIIAVLTLALGIGANTAIFSVVDAALLRSLPYGSPDQLVHLWENKQQQQFKEREASFPDYLDWKEQNRVFDGVAGYTRREFTLTGNDAPDRITGAAVTDNFFQVLGVDASRGRRFEAGEERTGAERVVILGNNLWKRRFNSDPSVIGRSLKLNEVSHRVVGVLPEGFQFAPARGAELWTPLYPTEEQLTRRFMHWLNVIARLKPGATIEQAQDDMSRVAANIAREHSESHAGAGLRVVSLHEQIVGHLRPILFLLLCTVGFVLLIACANVANLLLARSSARQKEIAIRRALGASQWRLTRQLLTESTVLALLGGALGLMMALWGVDLLVARLPEAQAAAMPYLQGLALDGRVLLFTISISLLTGMVFGLAPALQSSKLNLQESLKDGGRTSASASHATLRNLFVVSEIAIALVLLVGAGLMMKSLVRLLETDPGFNTERLLTMRLALSQTKYKEDQSITAFHQQLINQLESAPGVKGVATVSTLPLIGGNTATFVAEGRETPKPGDELEANTRDVSSNYFEVMSVPLMKGRAFTDYDRAGSAPVVIINQMAASRFFPGEDAIGKRLVYTRLPLPPFEIVGIVGDEKVNGLDKATTPVIYGPFLQYPDRYINLLVRTSGDPSVVAGAVRDEIQRLEPDAPVFDVRTMEQLIDNSPSTFIRRYPAFLIGVFASLALLLACIGIYGVISYSVTERTREIGIRMALGASRSDVLRMIVGQGVRLALAGVGLGLLAAFILSRFLSSLLFDVSASDPLIYAGVSLLLIFVSLLACYVPARRATRVDPMIALRYE